MKKNKKFLEKIFSIVLIFLSSTFSLLFAEGIIRLKNSNMKNYDVEMWRYSKELKQKSEFKVLDFVHKKNKKAKLQNVDININNFGLRGDDISIQNSNIDRRIMFLGGSITLGWGVNEEETLSSNIEKMLFKNGENAEVLNAGIGNYNAERYTKRFLKYLYVLKPTDIVVNYFIRDAEDLKSTKPNFFLKNSQLALTIWAARNQLLNPKGEESLIRHYESLYNKDSLGYKKMKKSLYELSRYAISNNINIYILMTPDIYDLKDYKYFFIHKMIKDIADEYKYVFVDSLPIFKNRKFETLSAMPGDRHPNALGHKLLADSLYPILKSSIK